MHVLVYSNMTVKTTKEKINSRFIFKNIETITPKMGVEMGHTTETATRGFPSSASVKVVVEVVVKVVVEGVVEVEAVVKVMVEVVVW